MNEKPPLKKQIVGLPAQHPRRIAYNFARWREAMELSHAMLMAGLRQKIGPEGDLRSAYHQWNAERRQRKLAAYDRAAARYFQRIKSMNLDEGKHDATDSGD
ncbi:hypothetical protein NZK35_22640 [Stieleria sp. ICT_E10.1]|uniref:hypothetical protein n=1 Tax=Stieleria sedimenti TaxID=2976331 RepID=UPI00218010D3|nr:hypothetical protein [Stieleria sedimenti]MCS7469460.1 hypothetical protein [Stieleria sedimenti]